MKNILNSMWVVLFTRSTYYNEPYTDYDGMLANCSTQAFFVGSLAEAYDFCKRYANHEVGWRKLESTVSNLSREYTSPMYVREGEDWETTLTLQMMPT